MKRLLLMLVFGLIIGQTNAQITLEHTYATVDQPSLKLVNLSISGYKYTYYDSGSKQIRIYNLDHTLWKSIGLIVPNGAWVLGDYYLAEELFDTDPYCEVAFVVSVNNTVTTIVRSELGNNIISLTGRQSLRIVNSGTSGWKMIVGRVVNNVWEDEVYALPGTGMPMRISSENDDILQGLTMKVFPNPAANSVQVSYSVPTEYIHVECIIINNLGQEVSSMILPNNAGTVGIDISKFTSGKYIVLLKSNGQLLVNSVFIK
jgi:hypothetical protein